MTLLVTSFLAGVLTVAAPCVLPLLPVIVGGTVVRGASGDPGSGYDRWRPLVIVGSLAVSVVAFTLLLKATTALLGVPQAVWSAVSGIIVIALGAAFAFPVIWERLSGRFDLTGRTGWAMTESKRRKGLAGDVLLGAALGPAFNSCSPTYLLIVATVLPASLAEGFAALAAYAFGLAGALLIVAYAGQGVVRRLGWLADPHGRFRRGIGFLLIAVGLAVLVGFDRDVQTFILDRGWYDPIADFERGLGL